MDSSRASCSFLRRFTWRSIGIGYSPLCRTLSATSARALYEIRPPAVANFHSLVGFRRVCRGNGYLWPVSADQPHLPESARERRAAASALSSGNRLLFTVHGLHAVFHNVHPGRTHVISNAPKPRAARRRASSPAGPAPKTRAKLTTSCLLLVL